MLDNLLQWSLCNLNAYHFQIKPVDLNKAIKESIDLLESLAMSKNLKINFAEKDNAIIQTDKNILDLALRNLIYNAIKFSYDNGKVEIHSEIGEKNYTIHIKDYGKGVPAHIKEKLFNVGEGIQQGTSNEKGTGLGLRLSKDFLEKVGGNITFRSAINEGAIFSIILPHVNNSISV
jgi:signal transduction histidine kinase